MIGDFKHGWLESKHVFSYGSHYWLYNNGKLIAAFRPTNIKHDLEWKFNQKMYHG